MFITEELRWFWDVESAVAKLSEWFCSYTLSDCGAGGPKIRTDEYLLVSSLNELGIKKRDNSDGVEIKGLIENQKNFLGIKPFTGYTQTWCKWSTDKMTLEPQKLIRVQKQRRLRLYTIESGVKEIALGIDEEPSSGTSVPSNGCTAELTRIVLEDKSIWWTFCLEAFGELDQVHQNLELVAKALADSKPPLPEFGEALSYPEWLRQINAKGNQRN